VPHSTFFWLGGDFDFLPNHRISHTFETRE
jgi:hypothetical protein